MGVVDSIEYEVGVGVGEESCSPASIQHLIFARHKTYSRGAFSISYHHQDTKTKPPLAVFLAIYLDLSYPYLFVQYIYTVINNGGVYQTIPTF